MALLYRVVFAVVALLPTALAQTCATINPAHAPTWGTGFSGRVVMNGLKTPRGMVFDSQNNLLVVESGGAGVRYIKLTDNGGTDVCVASSKQLIPERGVSGVVFLDAQFGFTNHCDSAEPRHRPFGRWKDPFRFLIDNCMELPI